MVPTSQDEARRTAPVPRQPNSPWRLAWANLYDVQLLLRQSAFGLIGFAVVALAGTFYLQTTFHERLLAALYETLQLLIFQSNRSLPGDPLGDLLRPARGIERIQAGDVGRDGARVSLSPGS